MYVFTTSGFDEKVEQYNLRERVNELCDKIESTGKAQALRDWFEPFPPYWKRRAGKLRLFARLVDVGGDRVLCLLDILERKDHRYDRLLRDPRGFGEDYLDPLIDHKQLKSWLKTKHLSQEREQDPSQQFAPLPDEMRPWLEPPKLWEHSDLDDWVIYESEEWVSRFRQQKIDDYWQTYYDLIFRLVDKTDQGEDIGIWPDVKCSHGEGRYILFSRIETVDTPSRKVLFLLAPFSKRPSDAEISSVVSAAHPAQVPPEAVLAKPNRPLTIDDLASLAERSYPAYLLYDPDIWRAIERDDEANLALSAEEEQILESVSMPKQGSPSLPLFINGRAGSGKSTMLLYLFAGYCFQKWRKKLLGDPLYLTYNERLLDVAKAGVKALLSSYHGILGEGGSRDNIPAIDSFFKPFRSFLLGMLPADEREQFRPEMYMSFDRFKRLYTGEHIQDDDRRLALRLPQVERWSPELCWYVIRTFIKGRGLDGPTHPDDYREVPRKERTIDDETFKMIYETIWERWYVRLTIDLGYWDEQDLVARVLELKCYPQKYTAVFCDEAQDFTRLELQLIMHLSVFSQYDLGYQPLNSLPFAFAGDPFQTLNPTGFRWASVQATFYEEVITALDPAMQLKLGMNFQELTYNYRSTPPLVRAANLILLWRHTLLDYPELEPQICWRERESVEPLKFIFGQNITAERLARNAVNTIIIVPCEEGEEASYVRQDAVLSRIIQLKGEDPPKNVLSATAAKGLEFNRVILYKFGEECDEAIWQLPGERNGSSIEFGYFFNKLYVGASRAKTYLFVVDSMEGDKRLWKYSSSFEKVEPFLDKARERAIWEGQVGIIRMATSDSEAEFEETDPTSVAEELERKGKSLKKPDLLRRAKQYYTQAGETERSDLCEAWALRFEEEFGEAGDKFLNYHEVEEARQCYWEGACWQKLWRWYSLHKISDDIYHLTMFMIAPPKNVDAIKEFTEFLTKCITEDHLGSPFSHQWQAAVDKYVQLISAPLPDFDRHAWRQTGTILDELARAGYSGQILKQAGFSYYQAKDYERALRRWSKAWIEPHPEFYLAKAEVEGYPEGLQWLLRAEADERIIDEWNRMDRPMTDSWLRFVGPALEGQKRYWDAFKVYLRLRDIEKVKDSFERSTPNLPSPDLWEGISDLVDYLVKQRRWTETIDAIDRYFALVVGYAEQKVLLRCKVVREIAYSSLQPEALEVNDRQKLETFVDRVLSDPDWQLHLYMQEVGSTLERIGGHVSSLRFYERFTNADNAEEQAFARQRWIVAKKRQVEYHRGQAKERSRRELANQRHDWGIPEEASFPQFPELPRRLVQGLPANTRVEELGDGNVRFQIDDIEVRTDFSRKVVSVLDTRDLTQLRVNLELREVKGIAEVISKEEEDEIAFEVPASGYSGRASYGENEPQFELKIRDHRPVMIRLP